MARAKLEESRKLRDVVARVEKQRETERLSLDKLTDEDRVAVTFGGYLQPEEFLSGDAKAWYGVGEDAYLVKKIVGKEDRGTHPRYWVEYWGWKSASLEYPETNLLRWYVDKYEEALLQGKVGLLSGLRSSTSSLLAYWMAALLTCLTTYLLAQTEYCVFTKDEAMPSNPNLQDDVFTMSATEFAESLAKSDCSTLKIAQRGEPPEGEDENAEMRLRIPSDEAGLT